MTARRASCSRDALTQAADEHDVLPPRTKGLSMQSEYAALVPNGRQVVSRSAAPCWWQGQAVRRRMAAMGSQPEGPGLWAHGAASSLHCVSTYAPSFFLAPHAHWPGAVHSDRIDRP